MAEAKLTKEDVIKYIEEMPVLELAELVKELEDRFGVTAAAPMAFGVASAAAPGAGGEKGVCGLRHPLRYGAGGSGKG